jgi:hypothetical protein
MTVLDVGEVAEEGSARDQAFLRSASWFSM